MASPNSLKRTCDDAGLEEPLQEYHIAAARSQQAPSASNGAAQEAAPTQHAGDAPLPNSSAPANTSMPPLATSNPTAKPTAKRVKLTFEEREVQRIEKEFKERQKAEEKVRKEEEKAKKEAEKESIERQKAQEKARKEAEKEFIERQKAQEKAKKEEEKRLKELEKEEKRKAKEEQARIKLEEKKQKEEESNKKARNQLRMDSFFARNSMHNGISPGSPAPDTRSPLSSRRSSFSEIQAMEEHRRSRSVSITPSRARKSDYEQKFQDFPLKPNTVVASHNRFSRDERGIAFAQEQIDEGLQNKKEACEGSREQRLGCYLAGLLHMPTRHKFKRRSRSHAVKDIMAAIDGTNSNPIDLTDLQSQRAAQKPLDLLKTVPVKYLKFIEDVRPPYTGTCTRLQDIQSISKLARNPFNRGLPDTDYDYDSEAEWEEPAEGEDLDSEGEEEPDDDDAGDEMGEFLDDEDATEATRAVKRRPMLGDQEPKCSGLCWEGSEGPGPDYTIAGLDWRLLKLDILMDNPRLPIDPYSTTYWQPTITSSSLQTTSHNQGTLMEPPRLPLHPINRQNAILSSSTLTEPSKSVESDLTAPMKPAKAQRLITPELMDEFKAAVQGSDLTKIAIVEILKKQFAQQPKDAIRATLDLVAERVGTKNVEKRWVLRSGF